MTDILWGSWIEHDGMGCPCVGQLVMAEFNDGTKMIAVAGSRTGQAWDHRNESWTDIVTRYRLPAPRAMEQIKGLLENLDEPIEGVTV